MDFAIHSVSRYLKNRPFQKPDHLTMAIAYVKS